MKILGLVFLFSLSIFAQRRMINKTTEALLSYDLVQERSQALVDEVKRKTLGDHAEKVLVLAPLVTGRFEFNAFDLNFYYDHRNDNQTGFRYNLKF